MAPGVAIVRSPADVFRRLEEAERVPVLVRHAEGSLHKVPAGSASLFPRVGPEPAKKERKFALKRTVRFSLRFPDAEMLDLFRKASLHLKQVLPLDRKSLSVTYSRKEEPAVEQALRALKGKYDFVVQEELS